MSEPEKYEGSPWHLRGSHRLESPIGHETPEQIDVLSHKTNYPAFSNCDGYILISIHLEWFLSVNLIEVKDKCGIAVLPILLAVEHDDLPARHHDVELLPPVPKCQEFNFILYLLNPVMLMLIIHVAWMMFLPPNILFQWGLKPSFKGSLGVPDINIRSWEKGFWLAGTF